ncbi:MAG: hypothetical protein WB630_09240, partial [Candidatus Acidiferrales bacterium]
VQHGVGAEQRFQIVEEAGIHFLWRSAWQRFICRASFAPLARDTVTIAVCEDERQRGRHGALLIVATAVLSD